MTPELSPLSAVAVESSAPREMRLAAARGILPVDPVEIVEVQRRLAADPDEELAAAAKAGFAASDPGLLTEWVATWGVAEALDSGIELSDSPAFLEAVLRSKEVGDETLVRLAERLSPDLQEILAINQARLLRHPPILEALRANPRLSGDVRRRLLEIEEEFFTKAGRAVEDGAVPAPESPAEAAAPEDLPPEGTLFDDIEIEESLTVDREGDLPPDEQESIFQKIQAMTVSQKISAARKGNKEVRGILIREMNRLVATAAISSPRMTPNEVESIASMRNVHEDVLRYIATNRDWSRRYPVMVNLVKNPRVPIEFAMQFVPRLSQRDMKSLSIDKGVSEQVRMAAKRVYAAKYQK